MSFTMDVWTWTRAQWRSSISGKDMKWIIAMIKVHTKSRVWIVVCLTIKSSLLSIFSLARARTFFLLLPSLSYSTQRTKSFEERKRKRSRLADGLCPFARERRRRRRLASHSFVLLRLTLSLVGHREHDVILFGHTARDHLTNSIPFLRSVARARQTHNH